MQVLLAIEKRKVGEKQLQAFPSSAPPWVAPGKS